jgi:uncharacterized membrane protein YfcA
VGDVKPVPEVSDLEQSIPHISFHWLASSLKLTKTDATLIVHQNESTIFQWRYLGQIIVTFIGFVLILLFKGPGHKPSVVGVKRCDDTDWGLLATMIIFAFIMTAVSIIIQKHDYELKKKIEWHFTPCDYKYTLASAIKFAAFAFISTFLAILVGFTPAFFYVPVLIMNLLTPENVIQTNAILSLYATGSATTLNFVFSTIPIDYFVEVVISSIIGTIAGIWVQRVVRRKTGKTIWSMVGFNLTIVACLVVITVVQSINLVKKTQLGIEISKGPSFC